MRWGVGSTKPEDTGGAKLNSGEAGTGTCTGGEIFLCLTGTGSPLPLQLFLQWQI